MVKVKKIESIKGEVMGKVLEFLNVPTVPNGYHAKAERVCEHTKLTFTKDLVECRSCGRQWKDYGTGGKQ